MPVSAVSINDLVDKAIEEAPKYASVSLKSSLTKLPASISKIADYLDKEAEKMEKNNANSLQSFKSSQLEKKAALTQIVKTYLELESK